MAEETPEIKLVVEKLKKKLPEKRLWAIVNQEEVPVGISLARTPGGALKKFEERTKIPRNGYHAEEIKFTAGFALLSGQLVF